MNEKKCENCLWSEICSFAPYVIKCSDFTPLDEEENYLPLNEEENYLPLNEEENYLPLNEEENYLHTQLYVKNKFVEEWNEFLEALYIDSGVNIC